jgi:diguanylate cyclase (GGDEF)-like protein
VAQAIRKKAMRPGDFVARYGGEEFVIILSGTPAAGALHIAEEIRNAVRQLEIPHAGSQVDRFVTVSLGVSQGDASAAMKADTVLRAADAALYEAKQQGRNRVVIADTERH